MSSKTYLLNVLTAIASTDCSNDSADRIFDHGEIRNLASLLLDLVTGNNLLDLSFKDLLLAKCYLSLLSEKNVGAIARSNIAANLVVIFDAKQGSPIAKVLPAAEERQEEEDEKTAVDLSLEDEGLANHKNMKTVLKSL